MPFAMPPGLRLPYDTDGTIGLIKASPSLGGELFDVHPNALMAMNSTYGGGMFVPTTVWTPNSFGFKPVDSDVSGMYSFLCLIFPEPTRLRGIFLSGTYDYIAVETSPDSLNGIDGTWNQVGQLIRGDVPESGAMAGAQVLTGVDTTATPLARSPQNVYRLLKDVSGVGIQDMSGSVARNVKAIRLFPLERTSTGAGVSGTANRYHMHLYGEPDTGAIGSNYVQAWRSDSDMRLGGATMSWGDVPLGSSADKTFRVKNQSLTDTANTIVISAEDLMYYPTPSLASQFLFSLDGTTWTPTVTIGALGPSTISGTVYVRRVTPLDSPLGTWSPKVRIDVGSWS